VPNRVYALLVGVNDYGPGVGALAGCLNDVDRLHDYLGRHVEPARLAVEILKDRDATRASIIAQFRTHLGQARSGDVALFQFCGHGARWASSPAFRAFFPDGRDEGLVCHDSRRPGGFDLADKELAVLIAEVAGRGAHTVVILDCCHSGSGTRAVDAFRGLTPRLTHEVTTERPLDSYLDGHYAARRDAAAPLFIPRSRHIVLAACERGQLAQESGASGVFTSTLVDVLTTFGGNLTYADLFTRCRAAVRSRAFDQDPQFETYEGFDAFGGFLGRAGSRAGGRYLVYCDLGAWTVECGALNGMPTGSQSAVTLALHHDDTQQSEAGTARVVLVGPQSSEIELDFDSAESSRYVARLTSLPSPPTLVAFSGDADARALVEGALASSGVNVSLVGARDGAPYVLVASDGRLTLTPAGRDLTIGFAIVGDRGYAGAAAALAPALTHVLRWEQSAALQNHRSALDAAQVEFVFVEGLADGGEREHDGRETTVDYARAGGEWRPVPGRFKVRNRSGQTLSVLLAYFSETYGIHVLGNEPIASDNTWMTVWGGGPKDHFFLEDGVDASVERFRLFVATEKVDDFLLAQPPLTLGAEYGGTRAIASVEPPRSVAHRNEWFGKDMAIRVVRRLDVLGAADRTIANGMIVVKGHPAVTANISLGPARAAGRGVGSAHGFHEAFEPHGVSLVNFAGARGAEQSVLELTDIQNAAALESQPLEIELNVPLGDDEGILPVVYDGEHILLAGRPEPQADGTTRVLIDRLVDGGDQTRGLLGSLKLYFLKTVLRQARVNQLRSVEFTADGSLACHDDVAAKVPASRRVLLLMHGLTGEAGSLAAGVRACGLDRTFDLVLTYDYEHFATTLDDTARLLKADLAAAGFSSTDGKHLTVLAHSMGGLVSRWFVEREGGNSIVDHLVLCGTPNTGSPLGRIEDARRVISLVTTLALNFMPAAVPFVSAALLLLNRTKHLTVALEQLHPASDLVRDLSLSDDPGIPYTLLAGDMRTCQEAGDTLAARLLARAGRSVAFDAVFGNDGHDVSASVASMLGVDGRRRTPAVRHTVACHHLSYFASQAGRQALGLVAW
jgi:Caspase domain